MWGAFSLSFLATQSSGWNYSEETTGTDVGRQSFLLRLTSQPEPNGSWQIVPGYEVYLCGGLDSCPQGTYCGSVYDFLQEEEKDLDLKHRDLNFGITSFDTISSSLMTNFIVLTQEEWSNIMYLVDSFQAVLE